MTEPKSDNSLFIFDTGVKAIWEPPRVACPKHGPSHWVRFMLSDEGSEEYYAKCWRDLLRGIGAGPHPLVEPAADGDGDQRSATAPIPLSEMVGDELDRDVIEMRPACPECNDTGRVEMYPGGLADGNYWKKCDGCGRMAVD